MALKEGKLVLVTLYVVAVTKATPSKTQPIEKQPNRAHVLYADTTIYKICGILLTCAVLWTWGDNFQWRVVDREYVDIGIALSRVSRYAGLWFERAL